MQGFKSGVFWFSDCLALGVEEWWEVTWQSRKPETRKSEGPELRTPKTWDPNFQNLRPFRETRNTGRWEVTWKRRAGTPPGASSDSRRSLFAGTCIAQKSEFESLRVFQLMPVRVASWQNPPHPRPLGRGFRIWGLGFRGKGLGFRINGLGLKF